ncbi:galactose oxidase-like domain-containing protein [Paraflavitalea speifideaquila]|uniref:galactose oxidase-like domain-containing protein n=1 Tax=Paraflavitalea speifideaquila TaxID=3076558 RepID=UPI0028EED864|nr:galactose oxidase-like domain-containing protein [Paraflavitalea speifideiaquila]
MPDGSVIVAGGVNPNRDEDSVTFPGMAENQKNFEIYKPSYLFLSGPRPTITSVKNERNVANEICYGRPFFVETPQVNDIVKVVLIRPGAMTHHTDTEQRHIPFVKEIDFTVENGKLRVNMISDRSVAPPVCTCCSSSIILKKAALVSAPNL